MFVAPDFFTTRRKTVKHKGKRQSKTEQHLSEYLAMFDDMTESERTEAAKLAWMPPRRVVEILLDNTLRQRDRVELVIVAFSATHPGHTPSWDDVARILGISRTVALNYGRQLQAEGRAELRDGKFCLRPAAYSHPIIRGRFPDIYRM